MKMSDVAYHRPVVTKEGLIDFLNEKAGRSDWIRAAQRELDEGGRLLGVEIIVPGRQQPLFVWGEDLRLLMELLKLPPNSERDAGLMVLDCAKSQVKEDV